MADEQQDFLQTASEVAEKQRQERLRELNVVPAVSATQRDAPTDPSERKNWFQYQVEDIKGAILGPFELFKMLSQVSPGQVIYRSFAYTPEERRSSVFNLGAQEWYQAAKLWASDPYWRKESVNSLAASGEYLWKNVVPIRNWNDEKGNWNPVEYAKNHTLMFLLDLSIIGGLTAKVAKAGMSLRGISQFAKMSPELANGLRTIGKAAQQTGEALERVGTLPFETITKGIPLGIKAFAKVAEKSELLRPPLARMMGRLPEYMQRKFLQIPVQQAIVNEKYLQMGITKSRFADFYKDTLNVEKKYNFSLEQHRVVNSLYFGAYTKENLDTVKGLLKMDDAKFATFLQDVQTLRDRMKDFGQSVVQSGRLSRGTVQAMEVDLAIKFNPTIRNELTKLGVTGDEIDKFRMLNPERKSQVVIMADNIMQRHGIVGAHLPTYMIAEEYPVVGASAELDRQIRVLTAEAEKNIEEAPRINQQITTLKNKINEFATSPDRIKVRKEAMKIVEKAIAEGFLSADVVLPTNIMEELIYNLNKFGHNNYTEPNAVIVGELSKRTFGYSFSYSLTGTLTKYLDHMVRYISTYDWVRNIAVKYGIPVQQLEANPQRMQKLLNAGYRSFSPDVMQNFLSRYMVEDTRWILRNYKLEASVQKELQDVLMEFSKAAPQDMPKATEKLHTTVNRIFGTHSATGLPLQVSESGIGQIVADIGEESVKFREKIKSANWYLIPPEVAEVLYYETIPRPNALDSFLVQIPVVGHPTEQALKWFTNLWVFQVLANARFATYNLVGHIITHWLHPATYSSFIPATKMNTLVNEWFRIGEEFSKRKLPQNIRQRVMDALASGSHKTFGWFIRANNEVDEVSSSIAFLRSVVDDPLYKEFKEAARTAAVHEKDIDAIAKLIELRNVKVVGNTILSEIRPILEQLKFSIEEESGKLTRNMDANIRKALKLSKVDSAKRTNRFLVELNAAKLNLEAAIADEARTVWMDNPDMAHLEYFGLIQAAYKQVLRGDLFAPLTHAIVTDEFTPEVALAFDRALARISNITVRGIVKRAFLRMGNSTPEVANSFKTALLHYQSANNPLAAQVQVNLTNQISAYFNVSLKEMMQAKLEEMAQVAQGNPLVFFGTNERARRRLLELVLNSTSPAERARIIAKIEGEIKANSPIVAAAAGEDVEGLFNRALKTMKDHIYHTGYTNPIVRHYLGTWMPFNGYYMFSMKLMSRLIFERPLQAWFLNHVHMVASDISAKGMEDEHLAGRIIGGHMPNGDTFYVAIRGADPVSQVADAIDQFSQGKLWQSALLMTNPFVKVAFSMETERALPTFSPLRNDDITYINGRAYRWRDGAPVRDGGMSYLDTFETTTQEILRQYPWYEIMEDTIAGHQREAGRWFWNAKAKTYVDSEGNTKAIPIPTSFLFIKLMGFRPKLKSELDHMKRYDVFTRRALLRDLQKKIRFAKNEESRQHWREVLQLWQKKNLSVPRY